MSAPLSLLTENFAEAFFRVEDEPLRLEEYQRAFLRNQARFRWVNKSRQVGFSMVMALEALAQCHMRDGHTAIFISYNQDDAKEKIAIARQAYESMPLGIQKRLTVDSRTELEFRSNERGRAPSRILSVPSKAPRGKKGTVYLDELAHYANDREVYRGTTALILRSSGQLTGCSTPLGQRGIFWEIATEEFRAYPHHHRQTVPWWLCSFFCRDIEGALQEASLVPTEELVDRFATEVLIEQFESLSLEDFEQEFCTSFQSETEAYYPYDLILPCTQDGLRVANDVSAIKKPEGRLVAGYDVGRVRDTSELAVFEEVEGQYTCRLLRSLSNVEFAQQEGELRRMLETLPIARLSIDRSGLGMHMAENLERDYPQVVAENFTSASKERWANDFKILLQRRDVVLPRDRATIGQIHSIKKKVLPSGAVQFDAERSAKGGHADRFWAIALACQKEREEESKRGAVIRMRVIGADVRKRPSW